MKKLLSILLVSALMLTAASLFPVTASAADLLTEGVSLLQVKKNERGSGYFWDNPNDTLTLTNLNLRTEDDYGFKICDGATVILNGDNYIEASKAAMYIDGDVVFRGSGTLTLVGGEYGFLCNSTKTTHRVTFSSGTYTIRGAMGAVKSDYMKVQLSGGKFTLDGGEGYAIDARELQTAGNVKITATGSFYSSYHMILEAADLSIESKEAAIIAPKKLSISSMDMKAGDSKNSLTSINEYAGQKVLVTSSTYDETPSSILFGDSVPFYYDILVLLAGILFVTAMIVLPVLLRRKRAAAAIAARDLAFAEQEKERKAAKKALKKKS